MEGKKAAGEEVNGFGTANEESKEGPSPFAALDDD